MLTAWTSSGLSGVNYMCINIYQVKLQLEGRGHPTALEALVDRLANFFQHSGFTQKRTRGKEYHEYRNTFMPPAHPKEAPVGEEYRVYQLDLINPSAYSSPVGDVMDGGAFC